MLNLKSKLDKDRKRFLKLKQGKKVEESPNQCLLTPDHLIDSSIPMNIAFLKAHAYYILSKHVKESDESLVEEFFNKSYEGETINSTFYRRIKEEFTGNLERIFL